MKFMKNALVILLLCCISQTYTNDARQYVGVFRRTDKQLHGIRYGNWGSRPFEYAWVAGLVPIAGKRVIDLGVGLPSQYNWFEYVVNNLKPSFYVGVDCDGRVQHELITTPNYEIKFMNMADLAYPDGSFDIAYCISTFEHIPYETFMQSIKEAHRVLKDDGLLVITLDEEWDKDQPTNYSNGWNTLEQTLIEKGIFHRKERSFGLPEFLMLIEGYFTLYEDDAVVTSSKIVSQSGPTIYYDRKDKDYAILNSGLPTNSCVSYALLKKKPRTT